VSADAGSIPAASTNTDEKTSFMEVFLCPKKTKTKTTQGKGRRSLQTQGFDSRRLHQHRRKGLAKTPIPSSIAISMVSKEPASAKVILLCF
tara:strand:+ start:1946 stop:2218 length:273 start_codon:yes stop_codon:yes gene_type:complete